MLLAGTLALDDVVRSLRESRMLYHSEADLQHSFAMAVAQLAPHLRVRLEVPFRQERSKYVDLLVEDSERRRSTALELKYFTEHLVTADPLTGEEFFLRSHAASDLARLHFVRDVRRLERFATPSRNGIAVMLTNARSLWAQPSRRETRDWAFRIHDGRLLTGRLVWGSGDYDDNDVRLDGSYELAWHPYANLGQPRGEFRWLPVQVPTSGGHRP